MSLRLFLCISIFAFAACKSGREHSASRKPSMKSNPRNSGANVWLVTSKRSDQYHPKRKSPKKSSKASSAKVVENVSVEQWDCPGPETARYMPRSTKMKIRENMRQINDELDGSQSNSGKVITGVVFRKNKGRNK